MATSKTYYIFRHGETFVTKENHIWYGTRIFSAPILEEGKPALKKLAQYLLQIPSNFNASSQIRRCRQTVQIINEVTGKEFVFDRRLNEWFLEPLWFFSRRLKSFLSYVEKQDSQNILICTHAAVIAGLVSLITKNSFSRKDLMKYPKPGVLLIIKNGKIEEGDFN